LHHRWQALAKYGSRLSKKVSLVFRTRCQIVGTSPSGLDWDWDDSQSRGLPPRDQRSRVVLEEKQGTIVRKSIS